MNLHFKIQQTQNVKLCGYGFNFKFIDMLQQGILKAKLAENGDGCYP
jgi:hypothetical protein